MKEIEDEAERRHSCPKKALLLKDLLEDTYMPAGRLALETVAAIGDQLVGLGLKVAEEVEKGKFVMESVYRFDFRVKPVKDYELLLFRTPSSRKQTARGNLPSSISYSKSYQSNPLLSPSINSNPALFQKEYWKRIRSRRRSIEIVKKKRIEVMQHNQGIRKRKKKEQKEKEEEKRGVFQEEIRKRIDQLEEHQKKRINEHLQTQIQVKEVLSKQLEDKLRVQTALKQRTEIYNRKVENLKKKGYSHRDFQRHLRKYEVFQIKEQHRLEENLQKLQEKHKLEESIYHQSNLNFLKNKKFSHERLITQQRKKYQLRQKIGNEYSSQFREKYVGLHGDEDDSEYGDGGEDNEDGEGENGHRSRGGTAINKFELSKNYSRPRMDRKEAHNLGKEYLKFSISRSLPRASSIGMKSSNSMISGFDLRGSRLGDKSPNNSSIKNGENQKENRFLGQNVQEDLPKKHSFTPKPKLPFKIARKDKGITSKMLDKNKLLDPKFFTRLASELASVDSRLSKGYYSKGNLYSFSEDIRELEYIYQSFVLEQI